MTAGPPAPWTTDRMGDLGPVAAQRRRIGLVGTGMGRSRHRFGGPQTRDGRPKTLPSETGFPGFSWTNRDGRMGISSVDAQGQLFDRKVYFSVDQPARSHSNVGQQARRVASSPDGTTRVLWRGAYGTGSPDLEPGQLRRGSVRHRALRRAAPPREIGQGPTRLSTGWNARRGRRKHTSSNTDRSSSAL